MWENTKCFTSVYSKSFRNKREEGRKNMYSKMVETGQYSQLLPLAPGWARNRHLWVNQRQRYSQNRSRALEAV